MEKTLSVVCDNEGLTLGPGGPTLPAAPGKPVAPYNGKIYYCLKNSIDKKSMALSNWQKLQMKNYYL